MSYNMEVEKIPAMPVLEKMELWKKPGVRAGSEEEAKGPSWWFSG